MPPSSTASWPPGAQARTTTTSSSPISKRPSPGSGRPASSPSGSTWPARAGKKPSCTRATLTASSSRSRSRPARRRRPRHRGSCPSPARLDLIEHHVSDLDGAVRLFRDVLDGRPEAAGTGSAELTWPGGKRIKLVHQDGLPPGGALHHVRFTRAARSFSSQEREHAGLLARHIGLTVELAG